MKSTIAKPLLALLLLGGAASCPAAPAARPHAPATLQSEKIVGLFRVSGPPEMASLLRLWWDGFSRAYPKLSLVNRLTGRDTAIYGIEMRTADIALLDRPINPFERYGTYEHSWIFPVEIQVATHGARSTVDPATEAVVVRSDNPLAKLTVAQLDGIFGAERDGGFDKLDWNVKAARGEAGNIRTWGQLGLGGALASAAIHPYGPASHGNGVITYFQTRVLQGGAMRNPETREYADPESMFGAMAADPQAIGRAPVGSVPAKGFRIVALASSDGERAVLPGNAAIADRSYPLAAPVYLYFTIDTPSGQFANPRVDPKIKAFVSYILSPAGQALVARDARYLPLSPAEASRQRAVLTSDAWPAERPKED